MNENLKNLLDKIKETAYYAGKVAADGAEAVGSKAGEIYESAKLRVQIFDLESDVRAELKELGALVYSTHRTGVADEAAIDEKLVVLDTLNDKIAALKGEPEAAPADCAAEPEAECEKEAEPLCVCESSAEQSDKTDSE